MKKIFLLTITALLSVNTLFALKTKRSVLNLRVEMRVVSDTLKSLTYHSEIATSCNVQNCMQSTLDSIKQYSLSSYILVYKVRGGRWAMEKQPQLSTINEYKINRITILENRIEVMGIKYPDKKYVVILE